MRTGCSSIGYFFLEIRQKFAIATSGDIDASLVLSHHLCASFFLICQDHDPLISCGQLKRVLALLSHSYAVPAHPGLWCLQVFSFTMPEEVLHGEEEVETCLPDRNCPVHVSCHQYLLFQEGNFPLGIDQ